VGNLENVGFIISMLAEKRIAYCGIVHLEEQENCTCMYIVAVN